MKKYCKIFLAVLICALLAFSASACSSESKTQDAAEDTAPALSESAAEQDVTGESQNQEDSSAQEDSTAENQNENQNDSGKETTDKEATKTQSAEDSVDFTVQQALEALDNYYGKGYEVNGTVSEGDYYYFAVYKNDSKYASVKVNMKNGDAVETITETGETANLNLFV